MSVEAPSVAELLTRGRMMELRLDTRECHTPLVVVDGRKSTIGAVTSLDALFVAVLGEC